MKLVFITIRNIAFVLGQMRNEISSNALIDTMENINEHPMVRHECAEALGNIATPICTDYLTTKLNDPHQIVRESCYVALDIAYYQNSDDLQYV
ncbi:hypothetical protein HZS_968 [Henneguya salminicola]|nr:hypothetical protein HZS_968 [Henneguya salminicola]